MTTLKKVADAISKADGHNPDYVSWVDYRDHAKAALEAMREMSLEQVWAIDSPLRDCAPDVAEGWRQEYRRIWSRGIDAILSGHA